MLGNGTLLLSHSSTNQNLGDIRSCITLRIHTSPMCLLVVYVWGIHKLETTKNIDNIEYHNKNIDNNKTTTTNHQNNTIYHVFSLSVLVYSCVYCKVVYIVVVHCLWLLISNYYIIITLIYTYRVHVVHLIIILIMV